jgi:hypothetical protein
MSDDQKYEQKMKNLEAMKLYILEIDRWKEKWFGWD